MNVRQYISQRHRGSWSDAPWM